MKTIRTLFQLTARFLIGWAVRPYVARKNDELALTMIGFAMNDIPISASMHARKAVLYRRCQWWGIA